jgi:predicted dehydrogenase
MNRIAIIGAGQIGSRHLQGLAPIALPIAIYVVDVSESALSTAKSRFEEVCSTGFKGEVHYLTQLSDLPHELDLVVIASSSRARKSIVKSILHHKIHFLILEKFLFDNINDYEEVEAWLLAHQIQTWVNCPRRMCQFYQNLAKELVGQTFQFTVNGNNWGLACNSVHFLDLFALLANDDNVALSHTHYQGIVASKRQDYIEFMGNIQGYSSTGSNFSFVCHDAPTSAPFITLQTPRHIYLIEEGRNGKCHKKMLQPNTEWEVLSIELKYQSEMSYEYAHALLTKGDCELATFAASSQYHQVLLNNFITYLRLQNKDNSIASCPIT